jgi:hypothetical protein
MADSLLDAARGALGDLTDVEMKLLRCFGAAEVAEFDVADDRAEPIAEARARVLRWLFANAELAEGSRIRGLHVRRLRVPDETLDLDGISAPFRVILEECQLGHIRLSDARLVTLKLSGTRCAGIEGDRLRVDHGLLLNEGFTSSKPVWLPAIRVGDDLNCIGGRFAAGRRSTSALLLDGATIGGRLYLNGVVAAPAFEADSDEPKAEEEWPEKAGQVSVQGARIEGNLLCLHADFRTSSGVALNLQSSVVNGDAAFEYMTANADLNLRQTRFDGTLTFKGSAVAGGLNLSRATVGGDIDFGRATKKEKSEGRDTAARLGSPLLLGGAVVEGRLDMGDADLARLSSADLSRSRIGYLDDRQTAWPQGTKVLLEELRLGGISVGQSAAPSFMDRLLRRSRPETWLEKRLAWLRAQRRGEWSPQPYGQVAAGLRVAGEDKLARSVAIARERDRRDRGGLLRISKVWNSILYRTIGYGYKPYWAFGWAALVIFIGWLVFDERLGSVVFTHEESPPQFYSLVYSIDVFLPIVDLHQADAFKPTGVWPNVTLWLEIGLGWLLTTLGVAGVTGLVRKD